MEANEKQKKADLQLFPSYLLITLISLIAVSWYALSFYPPVLSGAHPGGS
jgi:hypothetical protein